jgi:hypothetical protein
MSLAKLLDHLHMGDAIIIPGGDMALRMRRSTGVEPVEATDGKKFESRELLRNLIAARRGGEKK